MAATAAQVAELRRMVNEPTGDTYDDDLLGGFIERYPLLDERGEAPYTWDTSTSPPTQDDNDDWVDTYDLHAAAADVWQEKAAAVVADFDFAADGAKYSRSQKYQQMMQMVRHHRARRALQTHTLVMFPEPENADARSWIANLAESD